MEDNCERQGGIYFRNQSKQTKKMGTIEDKKDRYLHEKKRDCTNIWKVVK